jgi:hypothetical protein
VTSDNKTKTNRENAQKSTGPTSAEGKARSRLNALKTGLFTQGLVITAAGERQEDFAGILSGLQNLFSPADFLSLGLVEDLASISWRLKRVRLFESAEIEKQCLSKGIRRALENIAEVDVQKERFIRDYWSLRASAPRSEQSSNLSLSLENTRRQLERTSLGLQYLMQQIDAAQRTLEQNGYLSADETEWLLNACGIGDDDIKYFVCLNPIVKAEVEELKKDARADRTALEQKKQFLSEVLKSKKETMRLKKALVESLESAEEDSRKSGHAFTRELRPNPACRSAAQAKLL